MALYSLDTWVLVQFLESHLITPVMQARTVHIPAGMNIAVPWRSLLNASFVQALHSKDAMTANTIHVDRFIEQLGRLAEGEGLPRTAGRMMGLLIIAATPLGIDEISRRLKVSRASVSTNSRLLQSLAIAQLVSEPGSRRDYLQIRGDSSTSLLSLGVRRMQSMRLAIHEMRLATDGTRSVAMRARLQRMERLYDVAIDQIQAILGTWHDGRSEGDTFGSVEVNTRPLARGRGGSTPKRSRRERS